jgi:hypothetical protein
MFRVHQSGGGGERGDHHDQDRQRPDGPFQRLAGEQ